MHLTILIPAIASLSLLMRVSLACIYTRVKRERTITGANKQQPSKNRMMRRSRSALVGVYQVH